MVDMVKGLIFPGCIDYQNDLAALLKRKKACGDFDASLEDHLLGKIAKLSSDLLKKLTVLEKTISESKEEEEILARATFYRDRVLAAMSELRLIVDELETLAAKKHWPIPTYAELLYSVV
jgi:glutamine synthetase